MKCVSKKSQFFTLGSLLFILFSLTLLGGIKGTGCMSNCSPPTVSVSEKNTDTISFSCSTAIQEASFKVWYYRAEDAYTSSEIISSNTTITFSGLSAGTYTFYFIAICESGSSSTIIVDDLIMG